MFKKYILFAMVACLGAIQFAHADEESSGRTLVDCGFPGEERQVVIHEDAGGELVALLTTDGPGGSYPTFPFRVVRVGPGLTYRGRGILLHVNTDGPSLFAAPAMGMGRTEVDCKLVAGE